MHGPRSLSLALSAFGFAACAAEPPPPRPNVLILSIDTLRADHLGCYGHRPPTSPNLDALAARSAVFEHAESSSSWTLPSMTTLMTGLSVSAHRSDHLGSRLDPSYTTLAERLRDAGYDTAIVASHLFLTTSYGLQQGFTHVDTSVVQDDQDITSAEVSDLGIAWLEAKAAAAAARATDEAPPPWMLWLHYFDPHAPYLRHEGLTERFESAEGKDLYERDLYDGEIAFTDRHVGRLLDVLARSGLAGDTIVVVVADHGEEFGEHGNLGHGYALYEECVRVPLIVHVPGLAPRRVEDVVPTVDLMPTLLELCRVPFAHEVEGQTFAPLLAGGSVPQREAVSEVRWQAKQDMKSVRAGRWKLIDHQVGKEKALLVFDTEADPREECDAFLSQLPRAGRLHERLDVRLREARRIASGYADLGLSGLSPFEQARLDALGYTGEEGEKTGGVPRKPDTTAPAPVEPPK